MSEFIFPSDQDRADNSELDIVCMALEEVIDERDALENSIHEISLKWLSAIHDDEWFCAMKDLLVKASGHDCRLSSLARRDARMKAEALEALNPHDLSRFAKSIGEDAWDMNPVGICKLFNRMAVHYRNQAEEQS